MTTWITVCDTCKRDDWDATETEKTDGEAFAELIEAVPSEDDVRIRRVSCLMGCQSGCNVAIQSNGKLNYTLGNFTPDAESAQGIVAYAKMHADSETGRVPFREWPIAIKGHFVTRHPPIPTDE